ncbi:hypothetical protein EDB19DRAFT_383177 [Suillus lakei]|nr:hypothetical protein EDB19DRAFT_383177 [Suillus lakei]
MLRFREEDYTHLCHLEEPGACYGSEKKIMRAYLRVTFTRIWRAQSEEGSMLRIQRRRLHTLMSLGRAWRMLSFRKEDYTCLYCSHLGIGGPISSRTACQVSKMKSTRAILQSTSLGLGEPSPKRAACYVSERSLANRLKQALTTLYPSALITTETHHLGRPIPLTPLLEGVKIWFMLDYANGLSDPTRDPDIIEFITLKALKW